MRPSGFRDGVKCSNGGLTMWRRGEYETGTALGQTAPGTEADVRFWRKTDARLIGREDRF